MSFSTLTALKIVGSVVGIAAILGGIVWLFRGDITRWFFRPTNSTVQEGIRASDAPHEIQTAAEGLAVPWAVAAIPESVDMLVTERSGTLKRIGGGKQAYPISGVEQVGEGGLLGVAIHPDFTKNHWVYLYVTTTNAQGQLTNSVLRYRLENNSLHDRQEVLSGIPAAANHDGGYIAFGPDRLLYVATGDAGEPERAQDKESLAGKILRIRDDGSIPSDNPFKNTVYSYGHRNVQGLAWDTTRRLWATEHGRSGSQSGFDELNRIEKGRNYGWPVIQGDEEQQGMERPIIHSGPHDTWAPAGIAYAKGSLYFTGLRGQALYQVDIPADPANKPKLTAHFKGDYGRLRAVLFHDNLMYVSTSNRDGRGSPAKDDDKIIRFSLDALTP